MLHREEPLHRQTWLDGCVRITLRVANLIRVILNLLHQAGLLQVLGNLFTAVHTVHTDIDG